MRAPLALIAGSILLAGCTLPPVVYSPSPDYGEEAELPPVGVTIVDVEKGRVLLSTNRPAYVAVFEIIPERGATLVYPASPRQRQVELSGSRWLTASWREERRATRGRRGGERFVYAIASDRPLRLSDRAFEDAYLRDLVGDRAWRDDDPYLLMEKLAWHFVPSGLDEDWGEDLYALDVDRPRARERRVARIYCPDGSVSYVREEWADRASCPRTERARPTGKTLPRPDSVVASSGKTLPRATSPRMRPPVYRVAKPDVATGAARPPAGDDRPAIPQGRRIQPPKDGPGANAPQGPGGHVNLPTDPGAEPLPVLKPAAEPTPAPDALKRAAPKGAPKPVAPKADSVDAAQRRPAVKRERPATPADTTEAKRPPAPR